MGPEEKALVAMFYASTGIDDTGGGALPRLARQGYVQKAGWSRTTPRTRIYRITPEGTQKAREILEWLVDGTCEICGQGSFTGFDDSPTCVGCGSFVGMCICGEDD